MQTGYWTEFITLLDHDAEIRAVICLTNAIESLNALPARGQGPRALPERAIGAKCLYLVTRSLDPTGTGRTPWTMRWEPALNTFAITCSDRCPAAETY